MSSTDAGVQLAAKSAWAGLAAGFLHTLCGPDHLAVSPQRRLAMRMQLCITQNNSELV
jgi:hypothetical protein